MAKKAAVVAVAKRFRGPAMGQPVYNAQSKEKLGVVDAVTKTKTGKEYRLDNGTVITDLSQVIYGKSAIVKAILG